MVKVGSKTVIALVGRPNVGKSTMFNLLCGRRKAIVEDVPGLTRDRNYAEVTINDKSCVLVDTGGFEPSTDDVILSQMRTQTMVAIEQADIIVFLGDGKVGLAPSDHEIVRLLQQTDKMVFYVVNKIDSEKRENLAVDFYGLGIEKLYAVGALTGFGMGEFLDDLAEAIPRDRAAYEHEGLFPESLIKVAVVGRPNVGKSTLINLLLGEERLLANPQPGTTRDSIDTVVRHHGKQYLFIDTAGVRRRSRIVDRVEKYSVLKAFRSIDRADVVLAIMDAQEGVTEQDARIAGYAFEKRRCIILVVNKWDAIPKDSNTIVGYAQRVRSELKYLDYAPLLTISALAGTRVVKLFGLIEDLFLKYQKRIATAGLNKFIEQTVAFQAPGMHRKTKRIKIYYLTQVQVGPPTFMFFCNYPESIHFSYRRFLENRLREAFDFGGAPLRLVFKKRQRSSEPTGSRSRSSAA